MLVHRTPANILFEASKTWATFYKFLRRCQFVGRVVVGMLYTLRQTRNTVGTINPQFVRANLAVHEGSTWYRVWPPQVIPRAHRGVAAHDTESEGHNSDVVAIEVGTTTA